MSTSERMDAKTEAPAQPETASPITGLRMRRDASIVPADSIAGRALVAVIAIMSFLAALTLGGVVLVRAAATEWQSEVSREVTIQVRPISGRDAEAQVAKAVEIARSMPGITEVRALTKQESARLLEPWLGSGLALSNLPVPRLIVVKLSGSELAELDALRAALSEQVSGASLDDHRGFVERLRSMTASIVLVGIGILVLVIAATMLSVAFATRGAMSTNRPVVEVLHFVGAKDAFIAEQFQRHFLLLGLKGGAIGGGAAVALFFTVGLAGKMIGGASSDGAIAALFGSFNFGIQGYAAVLGLIVLIAVVTAATSRATVHRTLSSMD